MNETIRDAIQTIIDVAWGGQLGRVQDLVLALSVLAAWIAKNFLSNSDDEVGTTTAPISEEDALALLKSAVASRKGDPAILAIPWQLVLKIVIEKVLEYLLASSGK